MLSYINDLLREGLQDVKNYPQIQLAVILVIVMPLVFIYAVNILLHASIHNQKTQQEQAIQTIHTSLHSMLHSNVADVRVIQNITERITTNDTSITAARVLIQQGGTFFVLASSNLDEINTTVREKPEFLDSTRAPLQTLHWYRSLGDSQFVLSLQSATDNFGPTVITETWYDRSASEQMFVRAALQAYLVVLFVFVIIVLIAYWLVRTNSYHELYENLHNTLVNKQRFTQMITHELRAPLTAIRGYASMLIEDGNLSPKQEKQVSQIQRSSERVLGIVSELLEIAQIQSGKLRLNVTVVDLAQLVTETLSELRPLTKDKRISLSQSGILHKAVVMSDADRLQQILINLVSNAIKYSEQGRIEIEIRNLYEGYELRVKDTGLGISAENQRRIFAPFFRVQNSKSYDALGVGLGMWITRQYVDLLGATVDVESIKDVGTHVVVKIPKNFPSTTEKSEEV